MDLPVEIMESIKLVVNIETAKVLGIKIPESIMIRTDEVIRLEPLSTCVDSERMRGQF